ncbi:MAG: Ig domain-containing protein, partial [Candidatus Poseidoniaceae archaeon]
MDTNNAHTVVENQTIDPIGFHPPFNNGTTAWTVSPALPGNLSIDGSTGEITGSVNATLSNTTYTVTATHNGSATETFSFNLRSLADFDGDGLANDLPSDYDAAEGPTSGLVADSDDDGDGLDDSVETGTGNYVDGTDTGTNPLNPDTDGDGVCDEFELDGCTDAEACNYNAEATEEDGSCTYADAGYDCDGNCLN